MVVIVIVIMVAAAGFVVNAGSAPFEIHLSVRNFLFRGFADLVHLDLKFDGLSCERMIRVDDECIRKDLDDAHGHRASVRALCDEFITEGNILAPFEVGFVDFEDAVVVMMPESIVRGHRDLTPLPRLHARERAFEARDDLRVAVDVLQRFLRGGTIRCVAVFVEEDVRERDVRVGTNCER